MERPGWVRLGLWKVTSRDTAFRYLNASLGLALLGLVLGVVYDWHAYFAGGLVVAAAWYWQAIKWMDAHQGW